jgi:hypothetical protein
MDEADAVREWLGRTGYPLESEVAKAFRATGFEVFQGLHYEADSAEASGAREIDVLAVCEELVSRHPITRCTVIFVIECKTSSVPWVVFRGHSEAETWGAVGRLRMNAITQVNLLAALEREQKPWLLGLPADVGFRLSALATKERASGTGTPRDWDQAYVAVKQVVSAAQGVLRGDPSHLPTIAVPVIILGTRLFAVSYNDDGHEEVMPTSWERILWRGDRSGEPIAIDVVAQDFLAEYAKLAADGATEFLPLLRGAALDARQQEFRQQSHPGRTDTVVRGVESGWDAISKVVRRARRSRANRSR